MEIVYWGLAAWAFAIVAIIWFGRRAAIYRERRAQDRYIDQEWPDIVNRLADNEES